MDLSGNEITEKEVKEFFKMSFQFRELYISVPVAILMMREEFKFVKAQETSCMRLILDLDIGTQSVVKTQLREALEYLLASLPNLTKISFKCYQHWYDGFISELEFLQSMGSKFQTEIVFKKVHSQTQKLLLEVKLDRNR